MNCSNRKQLLILEQCHLRSDQLYIS